MQKIFKQDNFPRRKTEIQLMIISLKRIKIILIILLVSWPGTAFATQAHGEPEGIYVHQFAHLFFLVSMLILIYWLRQKKLTRLTGWRHIQYAAMFFILWNLTVTGVHFLDEQTMLVSVEKFSDWHIKIKSSSGAWLSHVYYIGKMDHLLCVPALLLLFSGLKKLAVEPEDIKEGEEQ